MPPNTTNAAARAGQLRDGISAERVRGVNADAHHVARFDLARRRTAPVFRRRCSVRRSGRGSPPRARTASRGVITAVPNERSLGLTRCTRMSSTSERAGDRFAESAEEPGGCDARVLRAAANGDAGVRGWDPGCAPLIRRPRSDWPRAGSECASVSAASDGRFRLQRWRRCWRSGFRPAGPRIATAAQERRRCRRLQSSRRVGGHRLGLAAARAPV